MFLPSSYVLYIFCSLDIDPCDYITGTVPLLQWPCTLLCICPWVYAAIFSGIVIWIVFMCFVIIHNAAVHGLEVAVNSRSKQ